jgi:predicted secreted Zn-dependent protease
MPAPHPGRIVTIVFGLLVGNAQAAADGAQPIPPVQISLQSRSYIVDAVQYADLRAQLDERRPQRADGLRSHALTEAVLTTRYDLLPLDQGCRLEDASVEMEITVSLPEWKPSGQVRDRLRYAWQRMHRALVEHERGHRELAIAAAHEIARNLAQLPDSLSCQELRQRASNVQTREQMRLLLRNDSYDRRTERGALQGSDF